MFRRSLHFRPTEAGCRRCPVCSLLNLLSANFTAEATYPRRTPVGSAAPRAGDRAASPILGLIAPKHLVMVARDSQDRVPFRMSTSHETDVAIIGAGPVGLFAVFECGMLRMRCHVVDTLETLGGQCAALYPEKPIYDIPGYPEIGAQALIDRLAEQAAPFNPVYHLGAAGAASGPARGRRLRTRHFGGHYDPRQGGHPGRGCRRLWAEPAAARRHREL